MSNLKKIEYFNVVTGIPVSGEKYGVDASIFRKTDNVDLVFDSRGKYLGLRICGGREIDGKYTFKKGGFYFKSSDDLKIWENIKCIDYKVEKTKNGNIAKVKL